MATTANFRRLFLRNAREEARRTGTSLADALLAAGLARLSATRNGQMVTSAAANGHSYSFGLPGDGITPAALADMCSLLLDTYEAAIVDMAAASVAITDDSVLTWMLNTDALTGCTFTRTDFSVPQYANRGGLR